MAGLVFTVVYAIVQQELKQGNIFHVATVDDIAVVAGSWEELQHSTDTAQRALHQLGVGINVEKTEVTVICLTLVPLVGVGGAYHPTANSTSGANVRLSVPPIQFHTPGTILLVDRLSFRGKKVQPRCNHTGVAHHGHIIPLPFDPVFGNLAKEEDLNRVLHQLHKCPIPFHGRV